jgi:hypothetical protein
MALNADIVEAVANANFKAMAEFGMQNTLTHQQRLNILAEKALAKSLESMDTTQATEMGDIGGVISSIQQLLKGAQTTLPQTGQ